jgi:hypothetical protein
MNPGDIVAPTMNYVVLFDRPLILGQSPEGTRIVGRARHDQLGLMLEESGASVRVLVEGTVGWSGYQYWRVVK